MSISMGGPVETLQRLRMSYDDYLALPEHIRAEWVDGEVVLSPTADFDHQRVSRPLANLIESSLPDTLVVEAVTVRLLHNRERIPDIAVLTGRPAGRWPDVAVDGPPALVVEILSPSTASEDWIRKSRDYLRSGIGQYWLLDRQVPRLTILEAHDGEWTEILRLESDTTVGEVTVGDHGRVALDLETLLAP